MARVHADTIVLGGPLEVFLRDLVFEDAVAELAGLARRAGQQRLVPPSWLPVILVSEDEAVYGLCLDNPFLSSGPIGDEALSLATQKVAALTPADSRLCWEVRQDLWGTPYATQPTFRLRLEHWRFLARRLRDSLTDALLPLGADKGLLPATILRGRVWRGEGPNPIRDFARAQSLSDLLSFARAVATGSDELHLRVSFAMALLALRQVRLVPTARAEMERILGALESEIVGEYHLDGQAALRALREAHWDDSREVFEI